jgi:signal transduction histidine kinase
MIPPVPVSRGRVLLLLAAIALVITGVTATSAAITLDKPFPSLVVDAHGFYSIVELPTWEPADRPKGLHRLVSINGQRVPETLPPQSPLELYAPLESLPIGHPLKLEFEGEEGPYPVSARVGRLGVQEFLFFFVTYALAAWVVLWSGGLVLTTRHRSAARRAYALWATSAFLFLCTFYDYHTNAWLMPLFSVSTVGILLGALWLAYAFPKPPAWGMASLRRVLIAVTLLGAAAALVLAVSPFTGWNALPIRRAIDWLLGLGIGLLALAVLLRLRRSKELERSELVTASWGLAVTPLLIALVHMLRLVTHRDLMHLVLPFIVLIFPLSIGYALLRNNLLEPRRVLTSRTLMVPFALGALLLSLLSTYLLYLAIRGAWLLPLLLILLGFALFILVMVLARRAVVQELDAMRRLEVNAAQTEKRQALSALGTEICHELVYPLNFLRDLLRRSDGSQPLDGEDFSMARMEIDRMDRLIHCLREHELPPPQLGPIRLHAGVDRALIVLRELIQEKKLSVSVDVPTEVMVNAEMDSLIQLLTNLLRNAAQSTPENGTIGVRYLREPPGPGIEVWDTGPGIPPELLPVLFTRRVSTKAGGYGIGLTVVERVARSFRWKVTFDRDSDRTYFRVTFPSLP